MVLDDATTEDTLDPFFGDPHNWMIKERHGPHGDRPREYIYGTEDLRNDIHFIVDHKLGLKYLLISGPDAQQIFKYVRRKLSYYPSPEINERARYTTLPPEERRRWLYRLALDKMDHGFDQATCDVFSAAIKDHDPIVRAASALGASYLGWPQLLELMRRLATDVEPDQGVRESVAALIGKLASTT